MKNLKKDLKNYLEKNGKSPWTSYTELYEVFPFDGHNLTTKQKSDRARSVWKRAKKVYANKRATIAALNEKVRTTPWKPTDLSAPELIEYIKETNKRPCGKPAEGHNGAVIDYACPFNLEAIEGVPSAVDTLDLKFTNAEESPVFDIRKLTPSVQPKVLIFDLETSPLLAYVWRLWKQNVNAVNGQLMSENMILSWSAKWLYGNKVMNDFMTPSEIRAEDDKRVSQSLWKLVDEADVVIAHNAAGFDVKIMNSRFLKHGIVPPSHYQVIDTLLHARKRFRLPSNKLDYLGHYLGMGRKLPTTFDLWARCMRGEQKAMTEMVTYCDQDVILLENIYLTMRPWIMPHPNFNLMVESSDTVNCPTCGSTEHKKQGFYTTYANKYYQRQCKVCSSTFRERKAVKLDKTNLTIATPN